MIYFLLNITYSFASKFHNPFVLSCFVGISIGYVSSLSHIIFQILVSTNVNGLDDVEGKLFTYFIEIETIQIFLGNKDIYIKVKILLFDYV